MLEALTGDITVKGSYVAHLPRVLGSLAAHGECVLVGRGASAMLPPESTLRVRLVAPLSYRKKRVAETGGQSSATAEQIRKIDRERNEFVKEFFHQDPTDMHSYDLVINSSRFSDEQAAQLIVQAIGMRQQQEG